MHIVILGCGRTGSTLARLLVQQGHSVAIIDKNRDSFRRYLGPSFRGTMVVGLGIDQDVLKRAGIEKADAFLALAGGDNTNLTAA
ncbi:MAG: potassium channel family protein, partial [Armatimonadota bacterium]